MSTNEKLAPGKTLGRYELLLPIAQGGMATVWAARQKGSRGFQKTVAVKTMLPALSEDPQFEQMFLDEAALAAKIHHPNVAEILDLGEEEDILYIVMEWVDGEALSTITKQAKKLNVTIQNHIALKAIIGRPVPSPRIKNQQFPIELEQVILKCLHKEADRRYQTMLELHQAIEKVQVSMGTAVVDDDVGSFVRSLLGDRGQKRRLAL